MVDYPTFHNLPQINNVTLLGNKNLEQLGIQPKGDYLTEIPEEYITEDEIPVYTKETVDIDFLSLIN